MKYFINANRRKQHNVLRGTNLIFINASTYVIFLEGLPDSPFYSLPKSAKRRNEKCETISCCATTHILLSCAFLSQDSGQEAQIQSDIWVYLAQLLTTRNKVHTSISWVSGGEWTIPAGDAHPAICKLLSPWACQVHIVTTVHCSL